MQLFIDFSAEMLDLPIAYNSIVQGFLYRSFSIADPIYSAQLHNKGHMVGADLPKLFTFGRLQGQYVLQERSILFPHGTTLEVRSPQRELLLKLIAGINIGELSMLGKNTVTVTSVTLKNTTISSESIHVRTQSPFTFKMKHSAHPVFESEDAVEKLHSNAKMKWLEFGFCENDFLLDIRFSRIAPRSVQCQFKDIYTTGWDGDFFLSGNAKTLSFLYDVGIGSRNSAGFGMFDLLP